jgi:predicted nucleic acid-binding protein
MIFVDTNVLLDIVTDDPAWAAWSEHQLEAAALRDRIGISPTVYAELSPAFSTIESLNGVLATAEILIAPMPRPALFLAGKVFAEYRKRGGIRTGVLPDFFIGAQAAIARAPLITRDPARYRTYFPALEIIAPNA